MKAVKENGKIVGYKDPDRRRSPAKTRRAKRQPSRKSPSSWPTWRGKTFFSILNGYGSAYGTILDRDYQISRIGELLDTTYTIIPLNPITTSLNGEDVPFDLRNDELMARYLPDAAEIGYARRFGQASHRRDLEACRLKDDFYGRFFDVNVKVANNQPSEAKEDGGGTGGVVPVQDYLSR